MAIDNPTDKIRELIKDQDFDAAGAALQFGSLASPVFKVLSVVKSILDVQVRSENVLIALRALCDEFDRVDCNRRKDLDEFIESDWFKRAVVVLVEEAARAPHEDHARLLARVAAHGCFPNETDAHRQEDLASYIHDLARLGTDDIQMLKVLKQAYGEVERQNPNLHDPNFFSTRHDTFWKLAMDLKIHPDDCLSTGARLCGFGLALPGPSAPRETYAMYQPTKRGFYLLALLEAAELPTETSKLNRSFDACLILAMGV